MATKFLAAGGDEAFQNYSSVANAFPWDSGSFTNISLATDFVHGPHQRSIKFAPSGGYLQTNLLSAQDSGSRITFYIYLSALPGATSTIFGTWDFSFSNVVRIRLTTAGVLQLWEDTTQIGSSGSTLSVGRWYRISLALTISSTTVNRFELFKDGISDISITNATIAKTGPIYYNFGNISGNSSLDLRLSDVYIDNASSLVDTGNIYVTAKRPNANGTTNGFNTQIGSGTSGYGSGHSSQVNERPLSNTNGWSFVGAAATTEEYNIESQSQGDINISNYTIIDYMGWLDAKSTNSQTATLIVNNNTGSISLTSTESFFKRFAGSTTYPAGTGTDIGIITTSASNTTSLYEAGIVVAYLANTEFSSDSTVVSESVTINPLLSTPNTSESSAISEVISLVILGNGSINKIENTVVTDSISITLPTTPTTLQVVLTDTGTNGFVPGIKIVS